MQDKAIIELYLKRDESAILQTKIKYGKYCRTVAVRIVRSDEIAEECLDDALLKAWQAIPIDKPRRLGAYLARLTRNIAINRYNKDRAEKRKGECELVLDELSEIIADPDSEVALSDKLALREAINSFLSKEKKINRIIFVKRYFYVLSIKEIARDTGLTESNVKVVLMRVRGALKRYLQERGIEI